MTTFLLIRHGETAYVGKTLAGRLPGVGLTETGRRQAATLVPRLRAHSIDAIYCSPLQRTQETAAPLAQDRNLTIQIRERLNELDFGDWTGRTLASLESDTLWKRFNSLRSITRIPGGELTLDVQARMISELEDLRRLHDGATVALFSHQDTIKAAVAHCLGMPLECFLRFEVNPGSVTIMQMSEFEPRLLTLNNNGTLATEV